MPQLALVLVTILSLCQLVTCSASAFYIFEGKINANLHQVYKSNIDVSKKDLSTFADVEKEVRLIKRSPGHKRRITKGKSIAKAPAPSPSPQRQSSSFLSTASQLGNNWLRFTSHFALSHMIASAAGLVPPIRDPRSFALHHAATGAVSTVVHRAFQPQIEQKLKPVRNCLGKSCNYAMDVVSNLFQASISSKTATSGPLRSRSKAGTSKRVADTNIAHPQRIVTRKGKEKVIEDGTIAEEASNQNADSLYSTRIGERHIESTLPSLNKKEIVSLVKRNLAATEKNDMPAYKRSPGVLAASMKQKAKLKGSRVQKVRLRKPKSGERSTNLVGLVDFIRRWSMLFSGSLMGHGLLGTVGVAPISTDNQFLASAAGHSVAALVGSAAYHYQPQLFDKAAARTWQCIGASCNRIKTCVGASCKYINNKVSNLLPGSLKDRLSSRGSADTDKPDHSIVGATPTKVSRKGKELVADLGVDGAIDTKGKPKAFRPVQVGERQNTLSISPAMKQAQPSLIKRSMTISEETDDTLLLRRSPGKVTFRRDGRRVQNMRIRKTEEPTAETINLNRVYDIGQGYFLKWAKGTWMLFATHHVLTQTGFVTPWKTNEDVLTALGRDAIAAAVGSVAYQAKEEEINRVAARGWQCIEQICSRAIDCVGSSCRSIIDRILNKLKAKTEGGTTSSSQPVKVDDNFPPSSSAHQQKENQRTKSAKNSIERARRSSMSTIASRSTNQVRLFKRSLSAVSDESKEAHLVKRGTRNQQRRRVKNNTYVVHDSKKEDRRLKQLNQNYTKGPPITVEDAVTFAGVTAATAILPFGVGTLLAHHGILPSFDYHDPSLMGSFGVAHLATVSMLYKPLKPAIKKWVNQIKDCVGPTCKYLTGLRHKNGVVQEDPHPTSTTFLPASRNRSAASRRKYRHGSNPVLTAV